MLQLNKNEFESPRFLVFGCKFIYNIYIYINYTQKLYKFLYLITV